MTISSNIVLIGLPSCGKTTLGKIVADKLSMKFIDLDQLVFERNPVRETDFSVLDAIRRFPVVQSEVILELQNETSPFIVATGADAVASPTDAENLRKLGFVVYIKQDRKLLLEKAKERFPFVMRTAGKNNTKDASQFIFRQYESTAYQYEETADAFFVNDGTIEEGAESLINLIIRNQIKG
jgi:shikimate kinase